MTTLITLIAVALFATLATAWASAVRSASLRRKFEALGKITGRTREEILRHVGKPPNYTEKPHAGREIMGWRRINFRIVLAFTDGVCDGVDYEA
jgi:hypothetical protein